MAEFYGSRARAEFPESEFAGGPDGELRRAILSRTSRVSRPTVVMMPEPPDKSIQRLVPGTLFRSLVPGTIVFFAAHRRSSLFNRLREAAIAYDYEALDLLSDRIALDLVRAFTEQPQVDDPTARGLSGVPSFAEFRYKHKLLVRGLFPISTWEVAEAAILWTGGALVDAEFTCIEYVTSPEAPELETLVVKVPPRLTTLERAVIDRVQDGMSELHLRGREAAILPAVVAAVAVRAAPYVARATPYVAAGAQEFAKQLGKRVADGLVFVATWVATQALGVSLTRLGTAEPRSEEELASLSARLSRADLGDVELAVSIDQLLDLRQELINQSTRQERR